MAYRRKRKHLLGDETIQWRYQCIVDRIPGKLWEFSAKQFENLDLCGKSTSRYFRTQSRRHATKNWRNWNTSYSPIIPRCTFKGKRTSNRCNVIWNISGATEIFGTCWFELILSGFLVPANVEDNSMQPTLAINLAHQKVANVRVNNSMAKWYLRSGRRNHSSVIAYRGNGWYEEIRSGNSEKLGEQCTIQNSDMLKCRLDHHLRSFS